MGRADVPHKGRVEWTAGEDVERETGRTGPALVFGRLADEDEPKHVGTFHETADEVTLGVPEPLLRGDGPAGGLGLELSSDDDDNPLLFELVPLGEPHTDERV